MNDYDSNDVPSILLPCVSCNRTFRPDALAKHSKVCEKTLMKKRKQFDSSKQRIQGTDLAEFLPVLPTFTKKVDKSPVRKTQTPARCASVSSSSKTPLTSPKSKWREKHKELVQTIAAARLPAGQAPVPVKLTGQEPCPYCDRTFGPKAYDRHLEWCREQKNRIQPKSPASQRAKERQEARTKYQAPLTTKVKQRSASRDKHQGGRDQSPQPQHTPTALRRKPATTNVLESMSTPNINQNFVKGGSLRSSTRSATSVKKPQQLVRYPLDDVDKLEADLAASHAGGPDSAYSSLNRKSPVGGEQEKDTSVSEAVARFCHECGAKYPVSAAKFCCQCGVRRLFI